MTVHRLWLNASPLGVKRVCFYEEIREPLRTRNQAFDLF
jgi:hypothetical protein